MTYLLAKFAVFYIPLIGKGITVSLTWLLVTMAVTPLNITLHEKLIPWSRVILENLIVIQLVEEFPSFHGIQTYITVFIRVRHWSLF